jgi:alanine racemase
MVAMPAIRATRAEIDLAALRHNAAVLRRAAGGTALAAVVKADAYGHGAVGVARALAGLVERFAVSLIEEGIELRDAGITEPILVMGPSLAGGHRELCERGLTAVVSDPGDLDALAAIGRARGRPVPIHIKVDTGMGRLGIAAGELAGLLARAGSGGGLLVEGLCTHFASADLPDLAEARRVTHAQLAAFDRAIADAHAAGATGLVCHAANSAGVIRFPAARFDLCRPGLAMYGNGLAPAGESLRPVMHLVSQIAQVRAVAAGQAVSYGGLWRAARASRVAVLPIGYADGYPRRLTGSAEVLVNGRRCPVVGAISMDMTLVDVTTLGHDAGVGDAVVFLGAQGEERITAAELAERAGVTEYEVTCAVSKRVPRTALAP